MPHKLLTTHLNPQHIRHFKTMEDESILTQISRAKWFFFDLDDTLHSFRRASSLATTSTLSLILIHHTHLNLSDLQTSYTRILASRTKSAFADGKTSHEYRAERFRMLLAEHGVQDDAQLMEALLECYEKTLMQNLEAKEGAVALLHAIKARGKKIAVVTEGPQDAQERTVEALGLGRFVDYLATTNALGVAKVDGMFGRVLEKVGVRGEDVVVVGDSWDRDIVPARKIGLTCVWFNSQSEKENNVREEGVIHIRSLKDLEDII
ncbi:hypothetical protein HBI06_201480 [Parastagonospora nodorum]|nr:hypothetical protein HBI06_201480 [Parastagonospora nodorum]KAH4231239.1 hypothetical protein HBI05_181900 [Parastagonospora nodorum]KAH5989082.1 hypothetical protein HBI84_191360 [Parastagonospora nodorum]